MSVHINRKCDFKPAYDLAVQTKGAMAHIGAMLQAGWRKKDSIDWSKYGVE